MPVLILALLLALPLPTAAAEARGHHHEQQIWDGITRTAVPQEGVPGPTYSPSGAPSPSSIDPWRPYLEHAPKEPWPGFAAQVMWCESRGNPDALGWAANEIGLMQINPGPWSYLWTDPGQPFYRLDPWEPAVNIDIAFWIVAHTDRGWRHWTCARTLLGT